MLQDQVGISDAFQTEICSPTQACLPAPNPFLQLLRPQALEQTWFLPLSHHIQSIHKPRGLQLQGRFLPLPFAVVPGPSHQHLLPWRWQVSPKEVSLLPTGAPHSLCVSQQPGRSHEDSGHHPLLRRALQRLPTCSEPKPRSCRGHLCPLAPATPAPEHWTVSTSRPVQSRTFCFVSIMLPAVPPALKRQTWHTKYSMNELNGDAPCGPFSLPLVHRWETETQTVAEPQFRPR